MKKKVAKTNKNEYLAKPEVSDSYGKGWALFKNKFGTLLGVVVIVLAIGFLEDSFQFITPDLAIFISMIISVLITIPLNMGANLVMLRLVRKEKTGVADMFEVFKTNYGNAILAGILVAIFVIVGFILLIIPGIFIAIRLSFVSFLIVDKKMKAMEAIKKSWHMTKGHGWTILLIGLLAIPIVLLGLILLVIGIIPAIMWIGATFAVFYNSIDQKKQIRKRR